jgi:O-antigen/teichoic acid export membrane protein
MKKEIISSSWIILSQLTRLILGVFVSIYIARIIGPVNYGAISYGLSILGFVLPVVLFGQQSVFPRLLLTKYDSEKNLLVSSLSFTLLLGFSAFLLLTIIYIFFINQSNFNLVIYLIISSSFFAVKDVYHTYYIAKSKGKIIFYVTAISLTIINTARLIAVKSPDDLIYLAVTYPIEYMLMSILYYKYANQNTKNIKINVLKFNWKKLYTDGWPLLLSGISLSINQRIDQVFLKWKLGFETVGNYAASVKIIEMISIIPYLLARGIFPYFIKLYKSNENKYYYEISIFYKITFFIGSLIGIVVYFFSESIIIITFGNQYYDSIIYLKIYAFSIPFSFIGALNSLHLKVVARYKSIMGRQIVNLIFNLVLNYLLITKYGGVGAAYSTIIALINSTIIYDLFEYKKSNINKLKFYVSKNFNR